MTIWKFDAKRMQSVELISQFYSSTRNVLASNVDTFFPMSVEITDAVEPYESLGEHPTEGRIELILPLFGNKG
jgi:hypothetical protein